MRLPDALAFLDEHVNLEADPAVAGRVENLSLDRIETILATLGDPHRAYPSIHITGTNGKGSVARMVTELLVASGLTVGTYTSPHVSAVNERIARNGEPISDEQLAEVVDELARLEAHTGVRASYFELLTAAAFAWFAEQAVDVAVVEVGLLGRWDATNVIDADVAVITNVGGDHTDFADGWREAVAREKAGIVSPGSHVVVGEAEPALQRVFAEVADDVGATLWSVPDDLEITHDELAVGGRLVGLRTPLGEHPETFLSLHGPHQASNALVAVGAVEAFFGRALADELVAEALGRVAVPGRLEVVARQPLVVVDGAHNEDGARALVDALADFAAGARRTLVLGVLRGRDPDRLVEALEPGSWTRVIATTAPSPRGLPAVEVAGAVAATGVVAEVEPDPIAAVRRAIHGAGNDEMVVITGSLYLVGAARTAAGLVEGPTNP